MFWAVVCLCVLIPAGMARAQLSSGSSNRIEIIGLEGRAAVLASGASTWIFTTTNQLLHSNDRLRTEPNSRVTLQWTDASIVTFGPSTEIEILPPRDSGSGLSFLRGIFSFFHRDKPGRIRIITRGAVAGVEGTEFVMAVDDAQRTMLSVIDGRVQFTNDQAALVLTNGEQAIAIPGEAPVRTAGFIANNVLQWSFYYPAVLDPSELELTADERNLLRNSIAAYQAGDLPAALRNYPEGREPASDAERVYYAAVLLSVGEVGKTEATLDSLSQADAAAPPQRLAAALRRLISAVKFQTAPAPVAPELATEFLAASYYEQSRSVRAESLEAALKLAREAVAKSPGFGFAWTRVAELEFSFGRMNATQDALNRGLALAPRNAQALALKGFVLAAQNNTREALQWFEEALAVDSGLGNAWLGRGLCRIRQGNLAEGRNDLLAAAAREPQRAELRSYLGKAYGDAGDFPMAARELDLAKGLDPQDPTAWLYSALLNQQDNRINAAIRDLEKSQDLNDNRSVYRSQFLLDQDRAVRSASLARIYQDAGMTEVSAREAARAVNVDYGNYSAHLFLGDSLNPGLDLISRRYETASSQEYLVANLLAPANAGTLSPALSQSEYSRLFERNRLGVVSTTEYLSRGAWAQAGAQYGVFDRFSYDIDALYASDPGQRVNEDFELRRLGLQFKMQVGPKDNLFARVSDLEATSGDLAQYYRPAMANPEVQPKEVQRPIASLGYHREWSPGVHTLFLATRLDDTFSFTNPAQPTLVAFRPAIDEEVDPTVTGLSGVRGITMDQDFQNRLEIYSVELQQIWQREDHSTIIGGRFQDGRFRTENLQMNPSALATLFPPAAAAQQDLTTEFGRLSFYGYHQWQILNPLQLIAGISYDWLKFPENFRTSPISNEEERTERFSPKGGVIWTPTRDTTVRAAYARSLSGASLDQSYQLEPSQVAGFVQSFRSIAPESMVGAIAGARFETYGISIEQKFDTGTYLGLRAEVLDSRSESTVGAFDVFPDDVTLEFAVPSGLKQRIDFRENALVVSINQLLDEEWSLGARYRLSQGILKTDFADVPDGLIFTEFTPRQRMESVLHQVNVFAIYNHPCGFFARGDAVWYAQSNRGYSPAQPGDQFWQFNAFAGYRFPRRKAEVLVGLLNIADQNYRLNPLNIYSELPRERTLAVRLQLNF